MTAKKPITSDQRSALSALLSFRAIWTMVKRANLDGNALQRLLGRGGELLKYIEEGIRRFSAALPDYGMASKILGDDFITPEKVTKAWGLKYSPKQLRRLAESLPSEEVLHELKRDGYALMPAPPKRMSLLDIRALKNVLFYSKEGGWYSDIRQTFSREDKTSIGWLAIKKAPIANSTRKTWSDQLPLLHETDRVPNAAEFAWFLVTYFLVNNVRLFQNIFARTSSVVADGVRVGLGCPGDELDVDYYWDVSAFPLIGLASARKFSM